MTTIGWIGLGAMGGPMAQCVAAAGYPVSAYDVSLERARSLAGGDLTAVDSIRAAATGATVLVLMVATPDQVEAVLFGEGGAAGELEPGAVVVVMATVGPGPVESWARRLGELGVGLVDAPVSGGVARAAKGDLLVMVSGSAEDLAATRPIIDAMASTAPVVGPVPGDGQKVKVVNQLLCGVHIAVAGEALALADSMGLDVEATWEVLKAGAAGSFMFGDRGGRMVAGAFDDVRSALDIFVKDMGIVTTTAKSVDQPTPLAAVAEQLYLTGRRKGLGRKDDSIVYGILRGR
ncbi:3-hydroxyisobutyrate dehydrogenase/putative dehydrogenase [Kribbella antiqua]|uniref:3-hydroxyisobutyrate dehydrogenase/putative dehydrogenase n=1 Tax=Kribbella antiqua TaxID=2512217 RepID=A0A4R2I843_9ACTN|nr:NAD(P)-dependent oxidoreductase [Kribbella antiqua]TCO40523.1 3-hydroxyisobutyrate dehydrogenase/putative dehydrogenase [Kribbella antiqua]